MTPRLNFKKQERIRRSRDFKQLYSRARRLSGPHLTINFAPNQLTHNRLGLSVSKRRFRLSVQRHCLARLLREVYRLNKMRFLSGYDIIVSARRFEQRNPRLEEIKKELLALAQKAGLLKQ